MRDYIIAQLRENSTWRGVAEVLGAVFLFYVIAYFPPVPDEVAATASQVKLALGGLATMLLTKGGMAIAFPDTTKAGQAVKVAQANQTIESGAVVVPPEPKP